MKKIIFLSIFISFSANAATLTVTSTADSGLNTLRTNVGLSVLPGNIINFSLADNSTIDLTSANLSVPSNLTISNSDTSGIPAATGAVGLTITSTSNPTRALTLNAVQLTLNTDGTKGIFTVATPITGTGNLIKTGAGTVSITGANTYSGGTTVSAGTLRGTVATNSGLQGNILNNATVRVVSGIGDGTYSGQMTGTGNVTMGYGTATITFSGDNSFSGGIAIGGSAEGIFQIGHAHALGSGTLTFGSTTAGTIQSNQALTVTNPFTVAVAGSKITGINSLELQGAGLLNTSLNITNTAQTITLSGNLSGAGGIIQDGLGGNLTLSGVNTYSGGTTISAGTLQGNTTSLQGNILNNASLIFNQNVDGAYAGIISGNGAVTKQGTGIVTFSGANTYSGGTTVSAGTLQGSTTSLQGNILNNASLIFNQDTNGTYASIISGNGAVTKQGTGIVTFSGANTYSGGSTVSAGTLQGSTTSLQGNILNNASLIFNQDTNGTYASVISGNGTVTKQGTGIVTFSGANTYSGGTTVSAGTLQGSTTSLQGNILNNATLIFNQDADGVYAGIISGNGAVTKQGTGIVTFSGANTYSGGTTVSAGTLQGSTTSLQGNILNNAALIFNQDADGAYAGIISGNGAVTKQGTGIVTFSGSNTYSGGTTISAGSLRMGRVNALAITGTVNVDNGAIYDLNNFSQTIGDLTGAGNITLGNATLTFGTGSNNSNVSGIISGTGSLLKQGNGLAVLSGANTYSGGTTVSAGTLQGSTTSLQGNILNNASLIFNQDTNGTYASVISGNGSVTKQGTGIVTSSGANTYSGGTTVSAGTLQGSTTSLQGNILNNASLIFNQNADGAYAGIISGNGAVTKQGTGIVTFSGANTYSGGTTVSAGTLQGSTTSLQGNILNNASLIFNQDANGEYAGIISGNGAVTKQGTGIVTFSGANTYSGGTTVSAGALQGSTTSLQGNITNNAQVMFNQNFNGNYAGLLNGTGTLLKQGASTIQLMNAINLPLLIVNEGGLILNNNVSGQLNNFSSVTVNNSIQIGQGYEQQNNLSIGIQDPSTFGQLNVNQNANMDGTIDVVIQNGGLLQGQFSFDIVKTNVGQVTYLNPRLTQNKIGNIFLFLTQPDNRTLRLVTSSTLYEVKDPDLWQVNAILEEIRKSNSASMSNLFAALDREMFKNEFLDAAIKQLLPDRHRGIESCARVQANAIATRIAGRFSNWQAKFNNVALTEIEEKTNGYAAGDEFGLEQGYVGPIMFTNLGKQKPQSNINGYHFNSYGGGLLADKGITECFHMGIGFTYSETKISTDDFTNNSTRYVTYQGLSYAAINYKNFILEGMGMVGLNNYKTQRNVLFLATPQTAAGRFKGWLWFARMNTGFMIPVFCENIQLKPIVGYQYSRLKLPTYVEQGGQDINLITQEQKYISQQWGTGLRLLVGLEKISTELYGEYWYDPNADQFNLVSQFASAGPAFSIPSTIPSKKMYLGGCSVSLSPKKHVAITASYEIDFQTKFRSQYYGVKLLYSF